MSSSSVTPKFKLEPNYNSPDSMRKFGDVSMSKAKLEKILAKATKSRKRELKEDAKETLKKIDELDIRSGLHKGGTGYKSGPDKGKTDPRTHITVARKKGGSKHIRFSSSGNLIQISGGKPKA